MKRKRKKKPPPWLAKGKRAVTRMWNKNMAKRIFLLPGPPGFEYADTF